MPHAAGDYTPAHLGLRDAAQKHIQVTRFEAGHMMFIHAPSRARMATDLRAYMRGGA